MIEQRRHQRIRFSAPPPVRIGQAGHAGDGTLENLSEGGLMVRTDFELQHGALFGGTFSVLEFSPIGLTATVASRVGDCFGARFDAGPIRHQLIQEIIGSALTTGAASILSVNEQDGLKTMRIVGGLNRCLRNDFLHSLTRVGIDDIDLSGVTGIDADGLDLCRIAIEQHGIPVSRRSSCVASGMAGYIL